MPYLRSQMVFDDYKWTAKADADDPYVKGFPDNVLLNRQEGYEMLYFINACARSWNWADNSLASWQHLEKIIREKVPSDIRSSSKIKRWIEQNYERI